MVQSSAGDLAARVTALERRLDAADSVTPAPPPRSPDDAEATPDPETFWALDGLRSRAGQHSAVMFIGAVSLPDAQTYQWQQAADADALLEADWDSAAGPLSALGHPVRLAVLRQVLAGRRTTAEIGALERIGTTGQLYHHLRQLTAAGWLRSVGRGRYQVPATRVVPLLVILTASRP